MKIFLLRNKQTKKYSGFTTATFPVSTKGNFEYLLKDVSDEDYKKIYDGWEVEWQGDDIKSITETQVLKDDKQKQELKKFIKEKINNKTATLDDVLEYLK